MTWIAASVLSTKTDSTSQKRSRISFPVGVSLTNTPEGVSSLWSIPLFSMLSRASLRTFHARFALYIMRVLLISRSSATTFIMSMKTSSFDLRINAIHTAGSSSYILLGFIQIIRMAVFLEKGKVRATTLPCDRARVRGVRPHRVHIPHLPRLERRFLRRVVRNAVRGKQELSIALLRPTNRRSGGSASIRLSIPAGRRQQQALLSVEPLSFATS